MLTYKKIHFVYKKDTALVCHPVYERPIRRRHVCMGGRVGGTLLHASQPEAHACHDSTVSPSLVEFRALAKTLL